MLRRRSQARRRATKHYEKRREKRDVMDGPQNSKCERANSGIEAAVERPGSQGGRPKFYGRITRFNGKKSIGTPQGKREKIGPRAARAVAERSGGRGVVCVGAASRELQSVPQTVHNAIKVRSGVRAAWRSTRPVSCPHASRGAASASEPQRHRVFCHRPTRQWPGDVVVAGVV
jgi:hypothetical protein